MNNYTKRSRQYHELLKKRRDERFKRLLGTVSLIGIAVCIAMFTVLVIYQYLLAYPFSIN